MELERVGRVFPQIDVPLHVAQEIASIGILPWSTMAPIGTVEILCGQPFTVTGYATRAEYLEGVRQAGLPVEAFEQCPAEFHFLRVSTD